MVFVVEARSEDADRAVEAGVEPPEVAFFWIEGSSPTGDGALYYYSGLVNNGCH